MLLINVFLTTIEDKKISRKSKDHATMKSYYNIVSLSLTNHEGNVEVKDLV